MHALVAGAGSDQLILVMITNQIHVCRFTRVFEQEFAQSVKDNLPYKVVEENVQLHIEVKTAKDGAVRNVGVEQLTAVVLAKLKETAEAHLGHRVEAAILTLPLQFSDDASRSAAVFAGRLAGLKAVRVALSEPVAAAIAYGLSCATRATSSCCTSAAARPRRKSLPSWTMCMKP